MSQIRRSLLAVGWGATLCLGAACGGERADAAGRPVSGAGPTEFDGAAALEAVRAQVAFGPRVPGTAAHQRAGDWLAAELRRRADTVIVQAWTHTTVDGRALPMRNLLARFRPQEARLCCDEPNSQ